MQSDNENIQNTDDEVTQLLEEGIESFESIYFGDVNDSTKDDDSENDIILENRINSYVENINGKILLGTLAPEVSKNEEKKRDHKDKLIKYVSIFLGTQFIIIFILIMIVIVSIIVFHALKNDFSSGIINMLFAFFGTYITSVIVELIFILKYIVVNVFDTSISALMEVFTKSNNKKQDE